MHTARFALVQGRPLAAVLPLPEEARARANAGNTALTDPAGCPPEVLGATGRVARLVVDRRPVEHVVLRSPEDLSRLWAELR